MEKNLLIGIVIFIAIIILFIFIKNKNNKISKEDTIKEEKNISNMQAPNKKISTQTTKKKGGIFDQVPNPVILKEKAAKWTNTESYEEDISKFNIDDVLSENIKKEVEISLSVSNNIDLKDSSGFKTQILLVDDSLVVRTYVGNLLKENNYDVILKNDGWEAISYLKSSSKKPELIISDIEMPNMNGFQLIESIREEKRYNNVPILVISAHAENHLKLMEDENIQGFIKKPFNDQELMVQIKYLLEN